MATIYKHTPVYIEQGYSAQGSVIDTDICTVHCHYMSNKMRSYVQDSLCLCILAIVLQFSMTGTVCRGFPVS